jgi:hypothetical protein
VAAAGRPIKGGPITLLGPLSPLPHLKGDHNGLEGLCVGIGVGAAGLGADIVRHSGHIGGVQCRVHLVQHKEGGGAVAVDGEQQGQGGQRLLAAWVVGMGGEEEGGWGEGKGWLERNDSS